MKYHQCATLKTIAQILPEKNITNPIRNILNKFLSFPKRLILMDFILIDTSSSIKCQMCNVCIGTEIIRHIKNHNKNIINIY